MNSFATSEIKAFEKKLGGYQYLLTFRYSNLCVKADPISLLPVSITVGNREQNIEDAAQVIQMDDFHLVVVPKHMDVLRDVQEGIFEAQQGEAKAVLQLTDSNASVSGSKTQLYGETTINAKTEVKGEFKAPKATIDNIEAMSSFKSPSISDGMAIGAPGAGSSLSAKLKTEDAPKE